MAVVAFCSCLFAADENEEAMSGQLHKGGVDRCIAGRDFHYRADGSARFF